METMNGIYRLLCQFPLLIALSSHALAAGDGDISRKTRKASAGHWAFSKPTPPPRPTVKNTSWPRNPIDSFVLARLEARGMAPSPEADRNTLIRRLSFDLTGLPPTPAEVKAFLTDPTPGAYESPIDSHTSVTHDHNFCVLLLKLRVTRTWVTGT
ncbi:MAG: DUF1549 domain-containing protein [Verrucomicrobiota bacterium]